MTDEVSRKRWEKANAASELSAIEAPRAALDRVDWPNATHCVLFILNEDGRMEMFQAGKLESYAQLGFAHRALHKLLMDG